MAFRTAHALAHDVPFVPPHLATAERRRHQRVPLSLLGRYMLSDRQEYPCQALDMSPGGVALVAPVQGSLGERVVCYLDHIGRLEGTVARLIEGGFALQMNVPLAKREKLAEQLTWLANRDVLGLPEDRRHERIVPRQVRTTLTLADGRQQSVRLLDVSISGAAMTCEVRPPVGMAVTVGHTPARIVRVSGQSVAVEFCRMLQVETFGENVTL